LIVFFAAINGILKTKIYGRHKADYGELIRRRSACFEISTLRILLGSGRAFCSLKRREQDSNLYCCKFARLITGANKKAKAGVFSSAERRPQDMELRDK
jgi:hypothetical protein